MFTRGVYMLIDSDMYQQILLTLTSVRISEVIRMFTRGVYMLIDGDMESVNLDHSVRTRVKSLMKRIGKQVTSGKCVCAFIARACVHPIIVVSWQHKVIVSHHITVTVTVYLFIISRSRSRYIYSSRQKCGIPTATGKISGNFQRFSTALCARLLLVLRRSDSHLFFKSQYHIR
jgi:hypothetical protein